MPAHRIARLVAVLAGIAGILLCALVPLLPVKQTTATIAWPQGIGTDGFVSDVTAPLVSGAPRAIDVTIPCQASSTLPAAGGLVFSTIPPAGIDASRNGLFVRANADVVLVAFRDTVAAVAPRAAVNSGACRELHIWANPGPWADFVGIPGASGTLSPDKKPQVAGLFTDLKVGAEPGLSARVDIDTRFITSPTLLKLAAMVLGIVCVLASIVALAVLDHRAAVGSRARGGACCGRPVDLAGRHRRRRHAAGLACDRSAVLRRRVQPHDRASVRRRRVRRQLLPLLRRHRSALRLVPVRARAPRRRSAPPASGCASRPPLAGIAHLADPEPLGAAPAGPRHRRQPGRRADGGCGVPGGWLPFNNGLRPEPLIAFGAVAIWALVENAIERAGCGRPPSRSSSRCSA